MTDSLLNTCDALFVTSPPTTLGKNGSYMLLDQFGVIDAVGPEARTFLHNQLTNDVSHLDGDTSRIGGFCSPKGRLIASFLYWALPIDGADSADVSASGIRLVIAADIREAIQKRLSMFVMRSKVKLVDATPGVTLLGFTARQDQSAALEAVLTKVFTSLPTQIRGVSRDAEGTLVKLPDAAGCVRYLAAMPTTQWQVQRDVLSAVLEAAPATMWDWFDVHSGEPRITAATQDKFVPQMINYEAIGGVNFRKGCYPGQEVVARSQYRGTIKRRATVAHSEQAHAGDEVYDETDPLQPCGHVVNAAPAPDGGVDCLVEMKLALGASQTLHVGTADGPALTVLGLPYALPDLTA